MKNFKTRICKMLTAMLLVLSMCTVTVFAASTAKATSQVKFRTAVVNKLTVPAGASAQVIRGNETLDAFEGMRLSGGDTLRTTGDATLYFLVDQNKIIRLAKDTEVVLENTLLGTKVKMKLIKGSMFFNVVEKLPEDESLQFIYGNITISVRGTSAVLSGQDGAFVMLLTDGVVQATETLSGGKEVPVPIEAGTKFEYAAGDPEKGTRSMMKTSSFTLSELPTDVVEEMKNDESLKARIVESVPVSTGPSGPVYTTPDKVNLETDCNKGENTMKPSEEIEKKAQETRGEIVVAASSEEDDGEDSYTESVITINKDTPGSAPNYVNPPEAFLCLYCAQEFASSDAHKLGCGHYACEAGDHSMAACGEHYVCKAGYQEADHRLADCHTHYKCDPDHDDHTQMGCGHFHCNDDPDWFHASSTEVGCSHYACKCFGSWRGHIAIIRIGNVNENTYMCCVGTGDDVACPLCGEEVKASEILSGVDHVHYDETNHCITCNGSAQSADTFRDLFRNMFNDSGAETEEKVNYILQYLDIDLTGSP